MGGFLIPYKGYIEANPIIPDLPWCYEDILFLAVLGLKYGESVPVKIGTQVIDHLVATMTEKELQHAGETWKQVHLSTLISKRNTMKDLNVLEYDLKGVKDKIHTNKGSSISAICDNCGKGHYKLDDRFKICECSC